MRKEEKEKKEFLSTIEAAKILGISRIAVFNKIKAGEIKAQKAGRSFIISKNSLAEIWKPTLTKELKEGIEEAVKKTVKEYSETLKLLGGE